MKKAKIGVIGLGVRGGWLVRHLLVKMQEMVITAVCDLYEDRVQAAADVVEQAGFPRPFETADYRKLLDPALVDGVLVISSWDSHVPIVLDALRAGIPVGCEAGGAYRLEDCFALVKTYEATKTPYMFLENCNYGQRELMILNMVQQGLFGTVVHCEGAYAHDLRPEIANGKENRHYRLQEYLTRNCENYPSHELGPIMQVLDINRSNRLTKLVSFASKSAGLHEYCLEKKADDAALCKAEFKQGDIVTTLITCVGGETIMLSLDTTLPRAYSRHFTVRGTKAAYMEDTDSLFLNAEHDESTHFRWKEFWGNAAQYETQYDHPLWKNITEEQKAAGHGGMDYFCYRDFVLHLLSGEPMPIDIYDAATIMSITALSAESIAAGGVPVEIPDFKAAQSKGV